MALASEAMKSLERAETNINNDVVVEKTTTIKPKSDLEKLRSFIDKNHLGFEKNGKKFVTVEVWQYIAQLKGLVPEFESCPDDIDGVYSVRTTCSLYGVSDRKYVSKSTMIATSDEEFLADKDKCAVWGMSETRAFARAMKNIYGYLLASLGFQATPWEEITDKSKKVAKE